MCDMQLFSRMWIMVILCHLLANSQAYPMESWPIYAHAPREYQDDDYYYTPKVQYYYDTPALAIPEMYGQVAYPNYYDPYNYYPNEEPKTQEERLAALPVGQETWFESDSSRWPSSNVDDVSATFLDNLILTQMAQDAQRRRENARAAFPTTDYENKETEDEDVRELKALAGKPLYHEPKTVPRFDDEDYAGDDGFINWNGNKRSFTSTLAPESSTVLPNAGQKEIVVPRPANKVHRKHHDKKETAIYNTLAKILSKEASKLHTNESEKSRRIDKRFVAGDTDLVVELRELKHRIPT